MNPSAGEIRRAKSQAVGGGRKRCIKGKSCSSACIAGNKLCLVDFPEPVQTPLSKLRRFVQSHGKEVATHAAKGVVAWKAGKVLAPAVSGYLETHYGIPRESSNRLAETVIQAVASTALDAKHLRNADAFIQKLLTETAAAYLGKAAHQGVESALSTEQARQWIQQTMPILAGKVTGITTAVAGGKVPSPGELTRIIVERSQNDSQKLLNAIRSQFSYAEDLNESGKLEELLADIAIASLLLTQG